MYISTAGPAESAAEEAAGSAAPAAVKLPAAAPAAVGAAPAAAAAGALTSFTLLRTQAGAAVAVVSAVLAGIAAALVTHYVSMSFARRAAPVRECAVQLHHQLLEQQQQQQQQQQQSSPGSILQPPSAPTLQRPVIFDVTRLLSADPVPQPRQAPDVQAAQGPGRPPQQPRRSALYRSCTQRAVMGAKVDGLQREQAEVAVRAHLASRLPSILASENTVSMADVKALTLQGCLQLLAFACWFGASEATATSTQQAKASSSAFPFAGKHQLLTRLVSNITTALVEAEAAQQQLLVNQLQEPAARQEGSLLPPSFQVQLHMEPGGVAQHSGIAGAAEAQQTHPFRSPLSFWLDTPCLTAGKACKMHVLLPAQDVVPTAVRALLVLRGQAVVDSRTYIRPLPDLGPDPRGNSSQILTAAAAEAGTIHVSLDLPGLVLPSSPGSTSLENIPQPLHLYILAAPAEAAEATLAETQEIQPERPGGPDRDNDYRTFLLAAAELLLLPPTVGASPLARELCAAAAHTISVLARGKEAASADEPCSAANNTVPLRIRVQAWEHHLQPLLCDIGLILENMPHIANVMADEQHSRHTKQQQQQQALDWLDLVAKVSSFCFESGFTAWPSLLLCLVETTTGLSASNEASAQNYSGSAVKRWALSLRQRADRLRSRSGLALALALIVAAYSTRLGASSVWQASILILSAAWVVWVAYSRFMQCTPARLGTTPATPPAHIPQPSLHTLQPPAGLLPASAHSAPQPLSTSPALPFANCASELLICASTQALYHMAELSMQPRSKSAPPLPEHLSTLDPRADRDERRRCVSCHSCNTVQVRGRTYQGSYERLPAWIANLSDDQR